MATKGESKIDTEDILKDWESDEETKAEPKLDYFTSIQDTLNEIKRESSSIPKDNDDEEIEAMLRNLLLEENSSDSRDPLFENMLSKLLGKELLYAPLNELFEAHQEKTCPSSVCTSGEPGKCRFRAQYLYLQELMTLWKQDASVDPKANVSGTSESSCPNEDKAIDLLVQIQECGSPPEELIIAIGGDPSLFNIPMQDTSAGDEDIMHPGCSIM